MYVNTTDLTVVMTLEELKQKNAEAAAAEQAAQPEETVTEEVQDDPTEPEDDTGAGEDSEEEGKTEDVPEWMQSDSQRSEKGQVPTSDLIALKKSLKRKVQDKDSEIEVLRQEINQLKGSSTAPPPVAPATTGTAPKMPKLEDFYDKADPDAAYQSAMSSWVNTSVESRFNQHFQTQQQQQQQQQQQSQINSALDQHYERAAKIVTEGMLTADEYQSADTLIRQAVESVAPGNGDAFVDSLLGRMGEGSEKVVVSLARNQQNLNTFLQSLRDDPTGISAAAYLGELRGRFNGVKRVSNTPRPGSKLKGDGVKDGGSDKRQYLAAHKSGNRQKAFDIKRAAKLRGVDVKQW